MLTEEDLEPLRQLVQAAPPEARDRLAEFYGKCVAAKMLDDHLHKDNIIMSLFPKKTLVEYDPELLNLDRTQSAEGEV